MADLNPCPFCGGGARMATDYDPDGITWHHIVCCKCGARSRGKWHSEGNDCPIHREEVRAEWNHRTDARDALVRELVEALRKAEIGLANAKSYAGRVLSDREAHSVVSALDVVREALSKIPGATS